MGGGETGVAPQTAELHVMFGVESHGFEDL